MTESALRAVSHDTRIPFEDPLARLKASVGGFSFRTKILGIVLGTAVLFGLIVTWQVRTMTAGVLMSEFETRGTSVASDLAARSVEPLLLNETAALYGLLVGSVADHPDAEYAFVLDSAGAVIAHSFGEGGFPAELLRVHATDDPTTSAHARFGSGSGVVHDFRAPILDGQIGAVRLGLNQERLSGVVAGITAQMLIMTAFIGLAGVAVASLLTWLLTRPIRDLVRTTREVRTGNLSARATHWSDDEIGALGVAFNHMVEDLAANRETIAASEVVRTRLLEQLIDAQEEERKRIARELHDSVGQGITSLIVGMSLFTSASSDPASVAKGLELRAVAEETLEQVRQLSRDLRPSALDDLGLVAALERYADDFAVHTPDISVDLHADVLERLPNAVETTLYRIVQEGMTNAARHSSASEISVLLTQHNGLVRAIIEDNGVGFDPHAARRNGNSVGIHGMQERAEIVGGQLTIESGRGGTTVFVEVPL